MNYLVYYVMPVVLIAISIWGMPSARGTHRQRSLIWTFVFLAAALAINGPHIIPVLDELTVTSFATVLVQHLFILAALLCLVDFVHALYDQQTARFRVRHAFGIAVAPMLARIKGRNLVFRKDMRTVPRDRTGG